MINLEHTKDKTDPDELDRGFKIIDSLHKLEPLEDQEFVHTSSQQQKDFEPIENEKEKVKLWEKSSFGPGNNVIRKLSSKVQTPAQTRTKLMGNRTMQ